MQSLFETNEKVSACSKSTFVDERVGDEEDFVLVAPSKRNIGRGLLPPRQDSKELGEGPCKDIVDSLQDLSIHGAEEPNGQHFPVHKTPPRTRGFRLRARRDCSMNPFASEDEIESRQLLYSPPVPIRNLSFPAIEPPPTPFTPVENLEPPVHPKEAPPSCRPSSYKNDEIMNENAPPIVFLPEL